MITSQTKTLQLEFLDAAGKKTTLSVQDPKADLKKADVDTAAATILTQNVFAKDGNDLTALNAAKIISRTVESIDA